MSDLRFAFRQLLKNPGFTAVAVLTLALGIGANTVMFSAINTILLRPLPYKDAEQLVWIFASFHRLGYERLPPNWANELFSDLMEKSESFQQWARMKEKEFVIPGLDGAEHVRGRRVSHELFAMLGVQPVLGRSFTSDENEWGRHRVVLLSYEFWQRRFGGDAGVVGTTLDLIDAEVSDRTGQPHDTLNPQSYTVIGVLPPGWHFPMGATPEYATFFGKSADLWEPESLTPDEKQRRAVLDIILARLKPGVTLERATQETKVLFQRLRKNSDSIDGLDLLPLKKQVTGIARTALPLLLGATGFVLLIACVNVANLFLARATARRKEFAIRAALGADRWQVVRQLFTESLVLACCGGGSGFLLAFWGIHVMAALRPANLPRIDEIVLDTRVLAFTFGISVGTSLLFGLVPALKAAKADVIGSLKESGRGSNDSSTDNRFRSFLVMSEVALSLVLLICAALLIQSFIRLRNVDTGYKAERVLTASLGFTHPKYTNNATSHFVGELLERVRSLPGVQFAAVTSWIPIAGGRDRFAAGFHIEGRPQPDVSNMSFVTTDYFEAMGIPILQGRSFNEQDVRSEGARAKIISESFARKYFPGENPLGQRIGGVGGTGEIVGVVKDTLESALDRHFEPHIYHAATPSRNAVLVIRGIDDGNGVAAAIRNTILSLDKDQPKVAVTPMKQVLADSIAERRFQMIMLGVFSGVALLLAAIGIYGLIAYSVVQRTHEIGIRMALGAQKRHVLSLIVRRGMTYVILGLILGWLGAFASTRVLRQQLFGVTTTDPVTFALVASALASVALVACWVPARRAAKVDPIVALKCE